ncbi:hypothetical protein MXD58_018895, partial [Frankia sp. AgKG'84/4]|nr:hypothetical protein [Frankia sp. AgKG'84/4]
GAGAAGAGGLPGASAALGGPASGMSGMSGMSGSSAGSGMPFMPMGGMGAGQAGQGQSRERQRNTWLTEDEEVWGTDPECAPAVIGRTDGTAPADPEAPQGPTVIPAPPSRDRTRRGR